MRMPSWKTIWKFTTALIGAASIGLDSAGAASALQLSNPDGGEVRALVIGIDDYQHVRKLKGATADARDIDSSLRTMGIRDVTTLIDADADPASGCGVPVTATAWFGISIRAPQK